MSSVLLLLASFRLAYAAPAMHGEVRVTPSTTVTIDLHEEARSENRIDFSVPGNAVQSEAALGDHFQPFFQDGRSAYFHDVDLFGDGNKEIFVRLTMVPMGVIRVFRWNSAQGRLERMTFGRKQEDGIPVPLLAPLTLEKNGDFTYSVRRRKGRTAKFRLHWNGKDYELPAKEVR